MILVPTEKRLDWNNAPVVLIALVLTNIFVFLLYQSGDSEKTYTVFEQYYEHNLLELEWPLYETYLSREIRDPRQLRDARRAYENEQYDYVIGNLLFDDRYYRYVQRRARTEMAPEDYRRWQEVRERIQTDLKSLSWQALGLKATELNPLTFLTHQFLHGGVGHLFGNMVFLVLFGFAVEAAIGHLRFLLFYLLAGFAAGLGQVITNLNSDVPLVGASGAISGVMAMYLAVFRLRKIEFFYWILFFVGYFRAPALLILPVYIAKEVILYFTSPDSNVAFMAHAGGFVGGALLIGGAWLYDKNLFNEKYIEDDQQTDARSKALAGVYQSMEWLRFDHALKQINSLIQQEGLDHELALLRYQIAKLKAGKPKQLAFRALMLQPSLSTNELASLDAAWQEQSDAEQWFKPQEKLAVAFKMSTAEQPRVASQLFDQLLAERFRPDQLILLANKLAARFSEKSDVTKARYFQQCAATLTQEGHHGVM